MIIREGWKYKVEEFYYKEYDYSESITLKRYEYFDDLNKGFISCKYVSSGPGGIRENICRKNEDFEEWYKTNKRKDKLKRITNEVFT